MTDPAPSRPAPRPPRASGPVPGNDGGPESAAGCRGSGPGCGPPPGQDTMSLREKWRKANAVNTSA